MRISDWSSDVCSSDLLHGGGSSGGNLVEGDALVGAVILRQAEDAFGDGVEQRFVRSAGDAAGRCVDPARRPVVLRRGMFVERSEGRRVGKEGVSPVRSWWIAEHKKKKKTLRHRHKSIY